MADSKVREWMDAQDEQERDTIAIDIAGEMDLSVTDVTELLQELQPYLNSDATMIEAANGMKILATVLSNLQTPLGRLELHALVEYLCVRLENKEEIPNFRAGVRDVALSLQALAGMRERFPRGDASLAAKAVFSLTSTSLREQKPTTRLSLFELLEFLVETYSATLTRDMGPHLFVDGLESMSALEKDPKCLRVLFRMYDQISQTWSLNSEDFKKMWDSFSKYWPISLREDPSDPSIPTTTELNFLIQNCFTSHDNYAVHAFDHLLEILNTTPDTVSAYTKNTVLEAFASCFSSYSISIAAQYSSEVWDALKFEVWDGTNDEFIDRTIAVISAIVRKLDNGHLDWQSLDTPLALFVIAASIECSQRLHDSKQQHVLGSGQILHAIGSGSHLAFDLIIRNVLPRMFLMWDDENYREKKILLLDVFNQILRARLDLRDGTIFAAANPLQDPNIAQRLQANENSIARSLGNFQQSLVDDVYITAMMERDSGHPAVDTPFRVNSITGLVHGARIPSFLSDYHKGTIISEFNDLVLDRTQKQAVHDEVISALLQIHIEDPAQFRNITLSKFMAALPNRVSTDKETLEKEMAEIILVLEAFTKISCANSCRIDTVPVPASATTNYKFRVFEGFQSALIEKIFGILLFPNQLGYVNALLAAMFRGLQLFDEVLEQDKAASRLVPPLFPAINPYAWIVMDLYQKFIEQKEHKEGILAKLSYMGFSILLDQDEKVNDLFVSLLGRITTLALRSSQTNPANNFLFNAEKDKKPSQVWYLFCQEEPAALIDSSQRNLEEGPAEKCLTNVLSMSLVAGTRREDKDQLKIHIGNAAISMIKNAISTKNNDCSAYSRVSMLHFLQLLINKFGAAKEKLANEDRPLPKVMVELAASCTTKTEELEVERTYQTLAYFAGACLAAGDRSDKLLIDQMVIGMLDPRVGRKVAQSFRILLAPSPIMNETNFCVIRKLHKQRLYGLTVDNLISQWRNNRNKEQKENYLIALAGIFAYMDPKILQDQAAETFPLILEGTNAQNDDFTMFTYINLIKTLVVTCPAAVSDHIDSVINRMTDRTHNTYDSPSDASVKCRAAALDVLALLVGFVERRKLLPRKAKVMVELDIALDDCSRTVRSAAERTKMHWFNLVEVEN